MNKRHWFWLKLCFHINVLISILYTAFFFWVKKETPFGPEAYPIQQSLQYAHIILVPLVVLGFGALLPIHIRPKLMGGNLKKKNSGIILIVLLTVLILSGYLVQFPFARSFPLTGITHTVIGGLWIIAFYWHLRRESFL